MSIHRGELPPFGSGVTDLRSRSFQAWMQEINSFLERLTCVSTDDLPDQAYAAWFDVGTTPEQAAKEILAEVGFLFDEVDI